MSKSTYQIWIKSVEHFKNLESKIEDNTMKYLLIILTLGFFLFVVMSQHVDAIGPYPCFYKLQRFDKLEYLPGDTISIQASHCNQDTTDPATLYIVDAKIDIFDSKVLADTLAGKYSIYQETKKPTNGQVEFSYKIPQSDSRYQYMVLISPGGNGGVVNGYFFTKENASNIVLSDLKILNKPKQGENLKFEIKATDGSGGSIPILGVKAAAKFVDCKGNEQTLANDMFVPQLGSQKAQYLERGILWGWLSIPQGKPGIYDLEVSADTFSASSSENHWKDSETKRVQFEVQSDSAIPNQIRMLFDSYYPQHVDYATSFADIGTTDSWHLTSQIKSDSCSTQEDDIPLKIDLIQAHIDEKTASEKFGSNFLSYGDKVSCYKMPELCSFTNVGQMQISPKVNEYAYIADDFLKPIRQTPGEYLLKATGMIGGNSIEKTIGIRTHNIKDYEFNTDEGQGSVRVDSWYSKPGTASFDKEQKKITINAETSDSLKRLDIYVNHYTLYGDYALFVDGIKQNLDSHNMQEYQGQTVFTVWGTNNKTTVEIVGTSAIPEFGQVTALILVLSASSIVALSRFSRVNL